MIRFSYNKQEHSGLTHVIICLVAALAAFATMPRAMAQGSAPSFAFQTRSYIFPFPQTDQYQLHIFGDYLAAGLAQGLEEAFSEDGSVKIINSAKSSAGLARPDRSDWPADIQELTQKRPVHIAVLMMGINDIRNIRLPGGTVKWGTEEWRNAYADQADRLIRALKEKNIAVYWVGMPIMAKAKTSEAVAKINDILRERAYINGAKFIDSWAGFTDQLGGFAAYGPDLTGQNKRLRQKDGITFTRRGNRKLANYVEVVLRRDLAAARRERNISLAGNEEEQRNLVPGRKAKAATKDTGEDAGADTAKATPASDAENNETPAPENNPATVEQAQDDSATKQETPEISAADKASISVFAGGYAPPGEIIVGDIEAGVTGLATVSPVTDLNTDIGERRLPVTERLYYKVLVKGEALKPKPGRADDFRWPRS